MRLSRGLPGREAQYKMAPVGRRRIDDEMLRAGNYRQSAVLALICSDRGGSLFIPLIERMSYNGAHSGQISLPGGKFEERDGSLEQTALRECREEIGVEGAEIIGSLTELFIPVSSFRVQPFIGVCSSVDPEMKGHEREVKNLIRLGLDTLLEDSIIREGSVELPDKSRMKAPYFEVSGHKVWGATAMMLNELREVIKQLD